MAIPRRGSNYPAGKGADWPIPLGEDAATRFAAVDRRQCFDLGPRGRQILLRTSLPEDEANHNTKV
jgi:hypothetical protein